MLPFNFFHKRQTIVKTITFKIIYHVVNKYFQKLLTKMHFIIVFYYLVMFFLNIIFKSVLIFFKKMTK